MSSLARAVALMAIAISSTFPLSHAATTPVIVPAAPAPAPVAVLVPSVFADSSSTDTPPPAPALVSAKSTTSNASLATDYASLFYQLYRQNSTSVPAMKLKQPVPDEVAKRIANYSLTFDTLPGLMQRALLWESGYLVGDQDMLARVYTRCGASTASLGVPLEQMNASGCFLEQCDVGSSDVFVRTCRPEQLRAVAQCAVTAVDTTSNSTIWRPAVSVAMAMTTTRAPANKTGITFVPELQVRRHEWRDPLNDDFVYVYAIHTSANDTGVCLSTEQDPSTNGETIPCVPYQRTMDADWCMPKPQPLVTRWLTDYADEVQQHGSDNPTPEHTPAMINNEDRAARNDQKDSHGVVVDKNFQYDGKSSDLAQQYYRRHLAGDVVSKMSIDGTLPREIQQRLTDVSLAFDDLPPMLQRALVWDTGFAYGDGSTLAGIYTKCGLGMADIAVSLRAFNNAGCAEQNCTDGSTGTVFKRSLYCTGDQMTSASLCASTDVSTPVHIAMWADGGHEDMLPDVTVTRHAWEDRNQSYLIYGIHTVRNEAAYSQCPEKGSLIIPCVQYTDDSRDSWCRPKPGQLVTSWLKQVAKEKQFNLLYLIPILLGVALATTALAVCIRRRSLRRPDQKDETARSSMASSRPFFSVRGAGPTPNNGDVDAMFVRRNSHDGFRTSSDASSDSSGDSMDNLSTNSALNVLLTNPRLSQRRLPYENLRFEHLLSKGAHGEVWLCSYQSDLVAVKRLLKSRKSRLDDLEAFTSEIVLTASLEHPNVARFVGVAWNSLQNLCMVSEYVERGDLQTYLKQHGRATSWKREKMHIAVGVAEAIRYLHQRRPAVLHRDLKSRNVLLTRALDAKLIDFGVSRNKTDDAMTAGVGTPYWTAPEILEGKLYSEKADVYSYGVLLSELDTAESPYHDVKSANGTALQPLQILQQVIAGTLRPEMSTKCPMDIAELATACMRRDPAQRPSAAEIIAVFQHMPIANFDSATFSF